MNHDDYDLLLGFNSNCRISQGKCEMNNSMIHWNTDIIHKCPLELIMDDVDLEQKSDNILEISGGKGALQLKKVYTNDRCKTDGVEM
jgi:hypothetical protein